MFRRRFGPWAFAFTASFVLVVAPSAVHADEDLDGDLVPDAIEAATARNVVWAAVPSVRPSALTISSRSVAAPTDDLFRIIYEEGSFQVQYMREADIGRVTSSYELELRKIIEWVDGNLDDQYQIDETVATVSVDFDNSTIENLTRADADGGQVHTFTMQSDPTEAGSQVTFVLTIAHRFMRLSPERILTPMEAKLDVAVEHTLENPAARLALQFRIETDLENAMTYAPSSWDAEHNFSTDESWVSILGGPPGRPSEVFFSWANKATVDGAVRPVAVTSLPQVESDSESREYDLYFAHGPGTNPGRIAVFHDPTLGVVSAAYEDILLLPPEPTLQGDLPLYGISLLAMAGIVAATVVLANRRRRRKE